MATDEWVNYNDVELINLSRTAQLAEVLGIDTVWVTPESVQWVQDALSGSNYGDITEAPWYDPGFPASADFAGIIPLSIPGLDDSTRESTTTEYITNGGKSGKPRNKTLPLVVSVALVARSDAGAHYGKRWLDRVLSASGTQSFCSGADLRYFQSDGAGLEEAPTIAHRRDVSLSRGTSVTRKRSSDCASTWLVTYTWTANDPFEYGEPEEQFVDLGSSTPNGPGVDTFGQMNMVEESCPVFDYSPIYDPLYPALIPPPMAPDFFPAGWNIEDGMVFRRFWALLNPVEPTSLNLVPVFTLRTSIEARMVRLSIWSLSDGEDSRCDPLFSVVVTYLPADLNFYIDGEQEASYVWDGASTLVRRTDSLVYSPQAEPVDWTSFNDAQMYVTMDIFVDGGGDLQGLGQVRADLSLMSKSD